MVGASHPGLVSEKNIVSFKFVANESPRLLPEQRYAWSGLLESSWRQDAMHGPSRQCSATQTVTC